MVQNNQKKNNAVVNSSLGELACNTQLNLPKSPQLTPTKYAQTITNSKLQLSSLTNSFSKILYCHLDYLAFSIPNLTEPLFHDLLKHLDSEYLTTEQDEERWSRGNKSRNYEFKILSPQGIVGGFNQKRSDSYENSLSAYDLAVDIKGSYLANLSPIEQYNLLSYLSQFQSIEFNRIDLAIDDSSYQLIPLNEMKKAHEQENNFGYQKQWFNGTSGQKQKANTVTEYFGSKASNKMVRVYNHKSKCQRFEVQLRKHHATAAIKVITNLKRTSERDEEWNSKIQQTLGSIAVGTIDFRDKSKLKNSKSKCLSKTKRLPFWQNFINQVGEANKIRLTNNRVKNDALESKLNWMHKFVKKPLAMLVLVLGEQWLLRLIEEGKASLTASERKTVECWKNEVNG